MSQSERRKRTQDRLLRAAIELLIERGYSNLTLDLVSRRAGLSRGAQTNYYPTKRDLVLATAQQVVADGMPKPLPRRQTPPKMAEVLEAFVRESKEFFLSPRYAAMIELHVAGRHDPTLARELEAIQRDARKIMDDTWLDLLVGAGASRGQAREIIKMTNHFMRGMALLACIQTRNPDTREIGPWTASLKRAFVE